MKYPPTLSNVLKALSLGTICYAYNDNGNKSFVYQMSVKEWYWRDKDVTPQIKELLDIGLVRQDAGRVYLVSPTSYYDTIDEAQSLIERQRTYQRIEAARIEFDRLHREGAAKFDMLWLQVNTWLSDLRHRAYLPEDRRVDMLLSACAYKVCEKLNDAGPKLSAGDQAFVDNMRGASDEYDAYTHEEVQRLVSIIDHLTGSAAAKGGQS
jgi:hypothetical protein